MLPQSTAEHYRQQQRLTVATIAAVRRVWARIGVDFDTTWPRVAPSLLALVSGAQLGAATAGAEYIAAVLTETNQDSDPVGEVAPQAFTGVASDGRELGSLLYGAVVTAKVAVGGGLPVSVALEVGSRWLDKVVQTQVADAARGASQVAMAARPAVSGYVRMLNLPSCSRCVILAGKWFGWNAGFLRHPKCDCRHIPASEDMAGDLRTDPRSAVRSGQVTGLSKSDTRALDDGADLNQVVNARRGRDGMTTSEGTRVNGRRRTGPRPTPEAIYRFAEDRSEAIRLLHAHGYIVGDIAAVARRAA